MYCSCPANSKPMQVTIFWAYLQSVQTLVKAHSTAAASVGHCMCRSPQFIYWTIAKGSKENHSGDF